MVKVRILESVLISFFFYVYVTSGPSLLIESIDSMIIVTIIIRAVLIGN